MQFGIVIRAGIKHLASVLLAEENVFDLLTVAGKILKPIAFVRIIRKVGQKHDICFSFRRARKTLKVIGKNNPIRRGKMKDLI